MLLLCMNNSSAQNVVREGNTFSQVSNRVSTRDTLVTSYTFKDSSGKQYPIIVNKGSGSCYVCRISKNGKFYRQYMKSEICMEICKELKIEYKPRKK